MMGFYIQGPAKGKAAYIRDTYGGKIVDHLDASKAMSDPSLGVIVVLDNGPFEAAGFAFDEREFEAFADLRDTRPKRYVVLPRDLAEQLSGF